MSSLEGLTLFGGTYQLLVFISLAFGLLVRTGGKALDKFRDKEITKFDTKWIYSAIVAFAATIVPAMTLMPMGMEVFAQHAGTYGIIGAMIITGFAAYGINEGVNYTWKRVEGRAEQTVMKSEKFRALIKKEVEKQVNLKLGGSQSETSGDKEQL